MTNHEKLRRMLGFENNKEWAALRIVRNRNVFEVTRTKNCSESTLESNIVDIIRAARDMAGWSARAIRKDGLLIGAAIRAPLLLHLNGKL